MPNAVDVLIVGAGPTGLTAALALCRAGLRVHLVDCKSGPSRHSKALVIHARTMEVFESLGVVHSMDRESLPFVALNARPLPFLPPLRIDLSGAMWRDACWPGWRSLPQDRTEALLIEALEAAGGEVLWQTKLVTMTCRDDGAVARLEGPDGSQELTARWVLGCDGVHGPVRSLVGIERPVTDLGAHLLLADLSTGAKIPQDEGQALIARQGVSLIVPMPEAQQFRLILHVDPACGEPTDPGWYDALLKRRTGLEFRSSEVRWVSLFRLRAGVASRLRAGPVFLLGDAAHMQSPVGGQGLNTGVQDAHNLAWKLVQVHRGWAHESLLDSYESERLPIARSMVRTTSIATRVLTLRFAPLWLMRGLAANILLRLPWIRRRFGPRLGMPAHRYLHGPGVVRSGMGRYQSGARLPNPILPDGTRLHALIDPMRLTVFGVHPTETPAARAVPLSRQTWMSLGLSGVEAVVVRPDRVVQRVIRQHDA